jgi:hypothetical protein
MNRGLSLSAITSPTPNPLPWGEGQSAAGSKSRVAPVFDRAANGLFLPLRERVGVRGNRPSELQTTGVLQLAFQFHFLASCFPQSQTAGPQAQDDLLLRKSGNEESKGLCSFWQFMCPLPVDSDFGGVPSCRASGGW